MVTRRIVISACALSLAVATIASAQQATHSPKPNGADSVTTITRPNLAKAKGPYGTTLATYPKLTKAKGPYGMTLATYPKLTKAKGPYGMTLATYPKLTKATGPYGMTVAPNSRKTTRQRRPSPEPQAAAPRTAGAPPPTPRPLCSQPWHSGPRCSSSLAVAPPRLEIYSREPHQRGAAQRGLAPQPTNTRSGSATNSTPAGLLQSSAGRVSPRLRRPSPCTSGRGP